MSVYLSDVILASFHANLIKLGGKWVIETHRFPTSYLCMRRTFLDTTAKLECRILPSAIPHSVLYRVLYLEQS